MLVLSRRKNEQITIGDDIVITIVRVRGQAVQVGIEAPREIKVMRSELNSEPQSSDDGMAYASNGIGAWPILWPR